ncbi:hypothetical protein HY522_07110 [bacterium]|nr:hypothetical protein [bacterium]
MISVATGRARAEVRGAEVEKAIREANNHVSPHVLGLSLQDAAVKADIGRKIRPYFRFIWLANRVLGHFPHSVGSFIEAVNTVLEQEDLWAETVKPRDTASPLLLPACSFEADGQCHGIWGAAEQFGDAGNIVGAARAIHRFHAIHWQSTREGPRRWKDLSSRVFNHMGPAHGIAPFPRGWKYSFRLPDGFHYDVTEAEGRAFVLLDIANVRHAVEKGRYLNIDPHGYVRL